MKLSQVLRHSALTLLACASIAFAQERGTADEAKALAERGLAHIKAVGPDKAFADFSDKDSGKWVSRDLYIVALKHDGTILANGANKALIGKNLWDVKDPDGKYFTRDMVAMGKKGSGWVSYQFTDPTTKKIAQKSSYTVGIPEYDGVIAVGIYRK